MRQLPNELKLNNFKNNKNLNYRLKINYKLY